MFAVDSNNTRQQITGVEWNYVFLSSVLRSFNPLAVPCYRICREFEQLAIKEDFLLVVQGIFRNCKTFKWLMHIYIEDEPFGDLLDKAK